MHFQRKLDPTIAVVFGIAALIGVTLIVIPAIGTAQQPIIKKAPVVQSDPHSGKQMYMDYCAPCHGKDGSGNGPAAAAMKTAPTNLTLLAKNNGGKYPEAHVSAVLTFGAGSAAHGSKDMPVWGDLFQSLDWSSSSRHVEAQQRIHVLNAYLQTLQAK